MRMRTWIGLAALLLAGAASTACVRLSNGTWYFHEAALPEGWPSLTKVGRVEIKDYPAYRAAVAGPRDGQAEPMNDQFGLLFRHIQDRQIAMTAPVEMGYAAPPQRPDDPRMVSMAFLYRRPQQGQVEEDGAVVVRDLPARTYVSIGVRGDYGSQRLMARLATLQAWLRDHSQHWQADGPPRVLGYNSPFVPPFLRYAEVQIPVRKTP